MPFAAWQGPTLLKDISASLRLPAALAISQSTDKSSGYGVSNLVSSNKTPSTRRKLLLGVAASVARLEALMENITAPIFLAMS